MKHNLKDKRTKQIFKIHPKGIGDKNMPFIPKGVTNELLDVTNGTQVIGDLEISDNGKFIEIMAFIPQGLLKIKREEDKVYLSIHTKASIQD